MSAAFKSDYQYQLGGSLDFNHPTYVVRQADRDLYNGLKRGEFCYVLNSRQTGKSSLRVQTMYRLLAEGIACAEIDLTAIGSQLVTAEQWYGGIIQELVSSFDLKLNRRTWWRERDGLSPVQRFKEFIEKVLLVEVSQNIVIFVDEIDSVLRLDFKDDFFAVIRACYNRRVEKPEYRRLTFALLGVATPSDLIRDKHRTPFNIGRAIELNGFQLHEALPLAKGLAGKASNPQAVLREIVTWSGGQPFLTQKLCNLVLTSPSPIPSNVEAEWIEDMVRSQVLENWESTDEPEHLRTISDRILQSGQRTSRLLGLYQQILQQGEVAASDSPEQTELRLSGLVVKQQGKLRVYNRIYASVFNQGWVDKALADLRPYAEVFTSWLASQCQDSSRLLRGQALRDAQAWAADKSLSVLDYQFLATSQELDKREVQIALDAEKEATQILSEAYQILIEAQQKAHRTIRRGVAFLVMISVVAATVVVWVSLRVNEAQSQSKTAEVAELNALSTLHLLSNDQLGALVDSIKAGRQLLKIEVPAEIKSQTVKKLQQAIEEVQERNRLESHSAVVYSVSFSPDGQTLASASADKTIKLWRKDGTLIRTLNGHNASVYSVSFSPDGRTLASASADKTIKLWHKDGTLLRILNGHSASVYSVSFSPDGQTIASASADKTIKLWHKDGTLLKTLNGHSDWVTSVSFSPDSQTIASASLDKTIKLWSRDGTLKRTLNGHSDWVTSVSFSPDGQTIASASLDKTIKLWSRDGTWLKTLKGHSSKVYSVRFSPDGQTIASGGGDKTIKLWSRDGSKLNTLKEHGAGITSVSFSPDGQTIASASADNSVKLWSSAHALKRTLNEQSARVYSVRFSPDGQTIASASSDKTIKLWSPDGTLLRTLNGHSNEVNSVRFSPDGQTIASASSDKTIKLWSQDGRELRTLKGHNAKVNDVSFSPDGQTIASASADNSVKLWSQDARELKTLKGHRDEVNSVSFSPDGQMIASASADNTVKLWSKDGKEIRTLNDHSDGVNSVSFSPDGQTIASASNDKTIKLWSKDGKQLKTLKGHSARVNSVSFSPDGQTLVSASFDKTIKLWSKDGKELKTLQGNSPGVSSVSFSPNGQTIASASVNTTIELWSLKDLEPQTSALDELMVQGCNWLHDYLKTNPRFTQNEQQLCDGIKTNASQF